MKRVRPLPSRKTPLRRTAVARKRGEVKRFAKRRDDVDGTYAAWIRTQPCCIPHFAGGQWGRVEAHHVKTRGAGGADLGNLVSLCVDHHAKLHGSGQRCFQLECGVDLTQIAADLYARYQAE